MDSWCGSRLAVEQYEDEGFGRWKFTRTQDATLRCQEVNDVGLVIMICNEKQYLFGGSDFNEGIYAWHLVFIQR